MTMIVVLSPEHGKDGKLKSIPQKKTRAMEELMGFMTGEITRVSLPVP